MNGEGSLTQFTYKEKNLEKDMTEFTNTFIQIKSTEKRSV